MALPSIAEMISALNSRNVELYKAYNYSSPNPTPGNLFAQVPEKLHSLITTVPWCYMLCVALEERSELKDVVLPEDDDFTATLRDWIEDADIREAMSQAHMECLRSGIAYVVASAHPDLPQTPLFTAESPKAFYAQLDVRTGKPQWAIRLYCTKPGTVVTSTKDYDAMTVYEPNWTRYYRRDGAFGNWVSDPNVRDVNHKLGEPPVEALINHRSQHDPHGVPEHKALWRLQDAAARNLTNMQIAQEAAAIPQKVITNADEDDFTGDEGEAPVTQSELILKRFLVLTGDAKIDEYSAAQLQNFSTAFNTIARNASAASGLPMDYLGVASDANPSSGDAIRGAGDRLVKRSLRFLRGLNPAWTRIIGKGARMAGVLRDDLARIKLVWGDPSANTPSAMSDAAMKLSQIQTSEGPVFDRQYIWHFMDVDPDEQDRMSQKFAEKSFTSLLNAAETQEYSDDEGAEVPEDGSPDA